VNPLQESIAEMMSLHSVLDDYKFSVTDQYIKTLYGAYSWPGRLQRQVGRTRIGLDE
jgi:hypothetical protein